MECPNCRAEIPDLAKFCSQCGSALARPCPSCGSSEAPGAKFCSNCGIALVVTSGMVRGPQRAQRQPPKADPAQRIHLTVMFCDVVGSTALSARLDPEDFREFIRRYHSMLADAVHSRDGFVAQYLGDGALVYFGFPSAHEDDAERAVYAALDVCKAAQSIDVEGECLQVRVGIATGLVVVGDLAEDSAAPHEPKVMGDTPNRAARLQALAAPGGIVIDGATRKLVGRIFHLDERSAATLKGFEAPVESWDVLGEAEIASRFAAMRSADTPLVGRQEEIELLLRRWTQAKAGEGRVILLSGEAGIGKSRLIAALRDLLDAQEPYTELHYFCSPHHENSALFPVINLLERSAAFGRDDSAAMKLDKLEALMADTSASQADVALLADLLLLPPERYPTVAPNARRRKEETFEALQRQFTSLAQRQPVLMTFEDLHWIDPTTLELLDLLVRRIEQLPVLLIATFRPDFVASWADQPHVTLMTLTRLSRSESNALVRQLAAKAVSFPGDLIGEIVERSDGVPLFLEEVTKTMVDGGPGTPSGSATPRASLWVPPTLHASLMARLDRIGPGAKEIAQIGATIGREFSYELAALVTERPEPELKSTLGQLVDAGLISQRGEPPRSSFVFKHGLLQDAAYSTLLRGPRRILHARIAEAIEEIFPEVGDRQPEVLARHRTEAGLKEPALVHWQRAGELALRRSAGAEALKHFSKALALLEELPDATARWQQELDIRLGLGTALILAGGFRSAGPEIVKHYARAVVLGRGLGEDKKLFRAMWGSWYANLITGQTEQALGLANELVSVAERLADPDLMIEAYHSRWANSHLLGLNAMTFADARRGIALYDAPRHHAHVYDYGGHDTGVCAYAHSAATLWISGFPEQAVQMSVAALELGHRLGHPPSLAHASWWSATLRQLLRTAETCRELCELTMRIGREQGSNMFVVCPLLLGWTMVESGDVADGLRAMEEAVAATRRSARRFYYDYELLVFAEALLKVGKPDEAQQIVEEALNHIAISNNRLFEAEAHRLAGLCLIAVHADRSAEAEIRLLHAMETAEGQGALSLTLRAATSLARLWSVQNRRGEAHNLLWRVYNRFTEGHDTSDLRDAKALLYELGQYTRPANE